MRSCKVSLPTSVAAQKLIFKFSSLLTLKSGVKFRICNYCGCKLENEKIELSGHLKSGHMKIWKRYLSCLAKLTKKIYKNQKKNKTVARLVGSSDEESEDDSEDDIKFNIYNAVDSLQHSERRPVITEFEKKFRRTFTYDRQPYREFSDCDVIEICNNLKKNQIHEIIGSKLGYENSLSPHSLFGKSRTVNNIARLLCEEGCYYLPGKCILDDQHTFDYKELMRKDLHEKFNPQLKNLIAADLAKSETLELDERNHPKISELCESIGYTTDLVYNSEGYLDIAYEVICKEMWDHETPLFILQEKKVLDVLHGLLVSSLSLRTVRNKDISAEYKKQLPGVNKPVLATMCHGPDLVNKRVGRKEKCCLKFDETRNPYLTPGIEHKFCRNFTNADHWNFYHVDEVQSCVKDDGVVYSGPVTMRDQTIAYPCTKGHRHCCTCKLCTMVGKYKCFNHKEHATFNLKKCLVQKSSQCQLHWIDHPENKKDDDINFRKNILFHNEEIVEHGRNYYSNEVILAGLKRECIRCRGDVEDHFSKHLTFHPQCKICLYESKTAHNENFWKHVCPTCGKRFSSQYLKDIHEEKHNIPRSECENCSETFSSQFNLHRHLVEQHNCFQENNNSLLDGNAEDEEYLYTCRLCGKECKYHRNIIAHIENIHEKKDSCSCKLCGKRVSFSSNLKRHYREVHEIVDLGRELQREKLQVYTCNICANKFKRKSHLAAHKKTHEKERIRYKCEECNNSFFSIYNLKHHMKIHRANQSLFSCSICPKTFKLEKYLKEHSKVHAERNTHSCDLCEKTFMSKKHLNRHMDKHSQNRYYCQCCGQDFSRKDNLKRHSKQYH